MSKDETGNPGRDVKLRAMNLLLFKDRTEKELTDRLKRDKYSQEEIDEALSYVKSFGYVNDLRYAENYISYRIESKSRSHIMLDLLHKGIEKALIEEAWDKISADMEPDEPAQIRKEIEGKYPPDSTLDIKEYRRLMGRLSRRGYQSIDIQRVLSEMNISFEFSSHI